jgi:hypothetical protein
MPWCGKAVEGCCGALIVNGGLYTQCFKEIGTESTYCKKHETKRPAGTVADRMTAGVMEFAPPDGKKVKPFSSYMAKNPVTREAIEAEAARLGWTIDAAQWETYVIKRGRPKKNEEVRTAAVSDTSDESGNESSAEEKPKKKTKKKVVTEKAVSFDLIEAKMKEAAGEEKVVEEKVGAVVEKVVEEKKPKKMYGPFKERTPPTYSPVAFKSEKEEAAMSDLCESEPEPESDGEGIDCEEWEYEGMEYAVDADGNVYDVETGDKVGIRKEDNGEYELVLDDA